MFLYFAELIFVIGKERRLFLAGKYFFPFFQEDFFNCNYNFFLLSKRQNTGESVKRFKTSVNMLQ